MADEEELGEVSQDDIDAMVSGTGGGAAEDGAEAQPAEDEAAGLLSQADIDAAMGGGSPEDAGSGELSQADIDAAMGGGSAEDAGSGESNQADIDSALAGAVAEGAETGSPEPSEDSRMDSAGNPFDDIAAAMADAIQSGTADAPAVPMAPAASAAGDAPAPTGLPGAPPEAADMPDFASLESELGAESQIDLLEDVELDVKIELGRTRMMIEDVLRLDDGSVLELDKLAGDPVDVLVNDRLVARGEVLVLNDNFCVRVNEIISQKGEAIRS